MNLDLFIAVLLLITNTLLIYKIIKSIKKGNILKEQNRQLQEAVDEIDKLIDE